MNNILTIGNSLYVRLNELGCEDYFFPKIIFKNYKIDYYNVGALDSTILKNKNLINCISKNKYNYIIICIGVVDYYPRYNYSKKDYKTMVDEYIPDKYWQYVNINDFKVNFTSFIEKIAVVSKNTKILIQSIFTPDKKFTVINKKNFNYFEYAKKESELYNNFLKNLKNNNIYFMDLNKNMNIVLDKYNLKYHEFVCDASTHIAGVTEVYPLVEDRIKHAKIFTELIQISIKELNLEDTNIILN